MSSLPLGLNQVEIQRGLTTSSTAIFVPFTTQELFQNGKEALYYGINALSNNLIMEMCIRDRLTTPTAPPKRSMSSLPPPNGTQSRYYTAHRAVRKSTNRSVKNRPEMIPKPYKRLGV